MWLTGAIKHSEFVSNYALVSHTIKLYNGLKINIVRHLFLLDIYSDIVNKVDRFNIKKRITHNAVCIGT